MTYNLRSKASASSALDALMNTWRITGSLLRASQPIASASRGTSRQPNSVCPSFSTMLVIQASAAERVCGSRGRNSMPTP
ncbi:MAG: hypothetical protein BWX80_03223 [Candidatus Hydrogenedentes bacterium ADurb.Bin101]|nr:MAG: hypothetical protein BWX80_03223 [Candidatus Hydrogenedentes bacterium ADurb.Bin101]